MSSNLYLCSLKAYAGGATLGYFQWSVTAAESVQSVIVCLSGKSRTTNKKGKYGDWVPVQGLENVRATLGDAGTYDIGTHTFLFCLALPSTINVSSVTGDLEIAYEVVVWVQRNNGSMEALAKHKVEVLGRAGTPWGKTKIWPPMYAMPEEVMRKKEQDFLQSKHTAKHGVEVGLRDQHSDQLHQLQPVVTEVVYEHERRMMGLGWGKEYLLPTDRHSFTDENIKKTDMDEFILPSQEWRWIDEWHVDKTNTTDPDGWWYAFNWPGTGLLGTGSKEWEGTDSAKGFVRRRKWIRTRLNDTLKSAYSQLKQQQQNEVVQSHRSVAVDEQLIQQVLVQQRQHYNAYNAYMKSAMAEFWAYGQKIVSGQIHPTTPPPALIFSPPQHQPQRATAPPAPTQATAPPPPT